MGHEKASTSKIKSTIHLLGLRRSCWKRTLRTSPSKASRMALQIHNLWHSLSRPDSLQNLENLSTIWICREFAYPTQKKERFLIQVNKDIFQRYTLNWMQSDFWFWYYPCWTLYKNSLRTDCLKWLGKLWVTLSLMKASMTACKGKKRQC